VRAIRKIIIHHTAVDTTLEKLRASAIRRGYSDIPYHFVITADGAAHATRPLERMGAHCKGHNADSVGVALMGNLDKEPPTEAQVAALMRLLADLRCKWDVPIFGHSELRNTACPGKFLRPVLDAIRYTPVQVRKHG
jgi:N-acetyl-anhydromuramyl-L-alanine amidase AmpD